MRRFPAMLFAGAFVSGIFCGASYAGSKPDVKNAKPGGWAADNDKWEKRAEARHAERKFIKDKLGRLHYIVELDADAPSRYDQKNPPDDGFQSWHKPGTRHLVQALAREYGFKPTSITSLTGPGFQAYLDENQVAALRADRRVVRVVEDQEAKFSAAVWADTFVVNDWRPWGVQAVGGGGASSNGGITVYVLDSGVNPHFDLNLVAQVSSQFWINPVGCYGHATHVAGIIGARVGNGGVAGVFPNVPIVSIAVGTVNTQPDCSDGSSSGNIIDGLEIIRQSIQNTGRVGIINISINNTDFQPGGTVGQKIAQVVTPAPGYAGAFLAQSADNDFSTSCATSYTGGGAVMVVGAIDDHGQRVVPLNGLNGFKNAPNASDEPGSNFGPCVSVWAPGNHILSTWRYGGYVYLSGTSMAAPHVTGLAAYLAETLGLNNPEAIRQAVMQRMVPIQGAGISIPNLSYQGAVAIPRVEFAEGLGGSKQMVGNFDKWQTDPIYFSYDSIGASNCNLTGYANNAFWYNVPNFVTAYTWPVSYLNPGHYRWTLDCVSSAGAHGTTEATSWVKRQVRNTSWLIATASTGYGWVQPGPTYSGPYNWSRTGYIAQRITSQNADYCQIHSSGWTGSPNWSRTLLWDSGQYFPTSYTFELFYLGDPHTAAPPLGPYDGYLWELRCWNTDGSEQWSTVWGTMQP